jgi:hypothetical protein
MAIYKVQTNIDGVFTSMDLALDGKRIHLAYDGNKGYRSTDLFNLPGSLILQWIGIGLSFQDWTITLLFSLQNADGSFADPKQWDLKGTIPQGGGIQAYESIDPTKDLKPAAAPAKAAPGGAVK